MTPAITPYFDPNQMPPWLRGGPRLNLGGVLGAPPQPMPPVGMPTSGAMPAMPGNVFNSSSLLQAPPMLPPNMGPPDFGATTGARPWQGMPGGTGPVELPTPAPAPITAMPDPVGGPRGIAGPYQPISQTLNPMAGMPQRGGQRMSRPGMVSA